MAQLKMVVSCLQCSGGSHPFATLLLVSFMLVQPTTCELHDGVLLSLAAGPFLATLVKHVFGLRSVCSAAWLPLRTFIHLLC